MPPKVIHFEALKCALRQGKDGVILSLVVHPNDLPAEILSAPIGQQWIVALAPYVESPSAEQTQGDITQPAGRVLSERDPKSPEERARVRSIMLCKEPDFQKWLGAHDENGAARKLKDILGIESRARIAVHPGTRREFEKIEMEYRQAVGQIAEAR